MVFRKVGTIWRGRRLEVRRDSASRFTWSTPEAEVSKIWPELEQDIPESSHKWQISPPHDCESSCL